MSERIYTSRPFTVSCFELSIGAKNPTSTAAYHFRILREKEKEREGKSVRERKNRVNQSQASRRISGKNERRKAPSVSYTSGRCRKRKGIPVWSLGHSIPFLSLHPPPPPPLSPHLLAILSLTPLHSPSLHLHSSHLLSPSQPKPIDRLLVSLKLLTLTK